MRMRLFASPVTLAALFVALFALSVPLAAAALFVALHPGLCGEEHVPRRRVSLLYRHEPHRFAIAASNDS